MKKINLTEWALDHKPLIYYFIVVVFVMGFFSYRSLGRAEDPDFVIRQMIIGASWPGATASQVEEQVTDKLEKKLQDTPGIDTIKSYSKPGQSVVFIELKNEVKKENIRPTWLEVRNMVNDIKHDLPQGVIGPFFNDRFDDTFGSIYALTSDGFSLEELREYAEEMRQKLLTVDNVGKVELVGVQPEKIFVEIENTKLAQLGIDANFIINTLKAQNTTTPSGMIVTSSDNIFLRVSGVFQDIDSIRNLAISANQHTFRLGDIANVYRSYADPPEPKMYYQGQPAIGIAVSMAKGGNILNLGEDLSKTLELYKKELPLGIDIHQVANQPMVVKKSIDEFVKVLLEAIVIVLIVSFISLGVRSGMVVAMCIPLVIAGLFLCMSMVNIDLHKISLGALIIALGLLVDDAIIVIEMMSVKLEQGWTKRDAACFAYSNTAFPRLTGTLVTAAGFMPVGFSIGPASEITGSIFWVVAIALIISWLVAGFVTPLLGYNLIKIKHGHGGKENKEMYQTRFYKLFRNLLVWSLKHRWMVIGITVASFVGSVFMFQFVTNNFFGGSTRPELIVEMKLPEGSSLQATEQEAKRFTELIKENPNVSDFVSYVGKGSPRFVLSADPAPENDNYAQFIIYAKGPEVRDQLRTEVEELFNKEFLNVHVNTKILSFGPPVEYPVMLRVSGENHDKVREVAEHVRQAAADNPNVTHARLDWFDKSKAMRLTIDQDKARMLGLDSRQLAMSLQSQLTGITASEFREGDKKIDVVFRTSHQDRNKLSGIEDLNIYIGDGKFVPVGQIAKISFQAEEGLIARRNLEPAITIQANIPPGVTGNDVTMQIYNSLEDYRKTLPAGYRIEMAGSAEDSADALKYLLQPVPAMVVIIMTLLMLQLQSVPRMMMVLMTAPLGFIGVSMSLLLFQRPFGFVAQLGVLSLSGMIIRNSVILIDQIDKHIKEGKSPWDAIIDSAIIRFRPIMLTAAAAILAMIPLSFSTFWGPMAVAIGGGLFVATVLTLLVLPVLYAMWFRVKCEQ